MNDQSKQQHVLDYSGGAKQYPKYLACLSLGAGLVGAILPWGGPLIGVFNGMARINWNLAGFVAFVPAIASVVLGGVAMALISENSTIRKYRVVAAAGIILSVLGFVFTLLSADMNWPYGSH
jgi:hypothetical protein